MRLLFLGATGVNDWLIQKKILEGFEVEVFHLSGAKFLPKFGTPVTLNEVCARDYPPESVFWFNERHFLAWAGLAQNHSFPIGRWSEFMTSKSFQRRALSEWMPGGFQSLLVDGCSQEDCAKQLSSLGQKFVIKPSLLSGGSRFVRVFSEGELKEAIQFVEELYRAGLTPIAETFVEGDEYCVDGVVRDGKATVLGVGKYKKIDRDDTLVSAISYNDCFERCYSEELEALFAEMLSRLGYSNGPFHGELKLDNNASWRPIEIHGRFGGSNITEALWRKNNRDPFMAVFGGMEGEGRHSICSEIRFIYQSEIAVEPSRQFLESDTGSFRFFPSKLGATSREQSGSGSANESERVARSGFFCSVGANSEEAKQNLAELLRTSGIIFRD